MKSKKIISASSNNGLGKFAGRPFNNPEMGITKIVAAHKMSKRMDKISIVAEGVAMAQMMGGKVSLR